MSRIPVPCIDCDELTVNVSRCDVCDAAKQAKRNALPYRQAYRAVSYRRMPMSAYCAVCAATTDLTKDHIIPLSKGGTNEPSNIQTLCRQCNSSKGATVSDEPY
jgi:5-methylcytosine-specific restriction endonuclease McrA